MSAFPDTKYIQLDDGRKIAYCEYGDPHGKPVFFFHGTPGSRHEPLYSHEAAQTYGYRLIAPDRPGIGRSDRHKGRSLLGWSDDVTGIADQLGLDAFGVMGASGGGPHTLACAYAIPERLSFSVVMGSWAPVATTELYKDMAPLDQFFSRLAPRSPFLFSLPFSWFVISSRYLSTNLFIKGMESSLCEADKLLLEDEQLASFFQQDVREAFAQGVRGPADESILLYLDWGFDLEQIDTPVMIIHGEEDNFAPYSFGEYLHKTLPNSRLDSYPGQGHLFLITAFEDIFKLITS